MLRFLAGPLAAIDRYLKSGGSPSYIQPVLKHLYHAHPAFRRMAGRPLLNAVMDPGRVDEGVEAMMRGLADHFREGDSGAMLLRRQLLKGSESMPLHASITAKIRLAAGTPARSLAPVTTEDVRELQRTIEQTKKEMEGSFDEIMRHAHDVKNIMVGAYMTEMLLTELDRESVSFVQRDEMIFGVRLVLIFLKDLEMKLSVFLHTLYQLRKSSYAPDWRRDCLLSFEFQAFFDETLTPLREACRTLDEVCETGPGLPHLEDDLAYFRNTTWLDRIEQYLHGMEDILRGTQHVDPVDLTQCLRSDDVFRIVKESGVSLETRISVEKSLVRGPEIDVISLVINPIRNACQAMQNQADRTLVVGAVETFLSQEMIDALAAAPGIFFGGTLLPGAYYMASVDDNGPGFPPEKWARMNEPHISGHGSTGIGVVAMLNLIERRFGDAVVIKTGPTGTHVGIWMRKFHGVTSPGQTTDVSVIHG